MKNIVYILFLFSLISFFSCNKKTVTDEEAIDSTALSVAVLPVYDCIPFYYADQEGIFDSLGINIRLITFKSSMDADTAFQRGEAFGLVTDLVKASLWRSLGDSSKVVMAMDPTISLVTTKASRLFQTSSIKERIIAITRHSMLDFIADKILETVKMVSTDLNKPQINDIKLRTHMNNQDQYDGALLPEPYTSETTTMYGAKLLTNSAQLGLHYMATLVFQDSIITARRDEISKLVTAYNIAVAQLNDRQPNPLQYIPKEFAIDIPDSIYQPQPFTASGLPSENLLTSINSWLTTRQLIKSPSTYKSLIDSSFNSK